ncbi:MAG: DUF2079 domain-containing protein [Armatimonadetes bacterium]|nr:DUF2079 domain-containing protein [Armatimonadota bacterium]
MPVLVGALLGLVALAWALTGGVVAEVMGVRISITSLARPAMIALVLMMGWALLSRDGLQRLVARIEEWSPETHVRVAWGMGAAFAGWLAVLKLWQHHVFQTSAYDLGLYMNAIHNTAHGNWFHESIMDMHYLGDHFSPVFALLAPLWRLWPDARMLLLLQCLVLGSALVAVYLLSLTLVGRKWCAPAVALLFATNMYLHRVDAFDFHPMALAVGSTLWLLYAIERGRYRWAVLLTILTMIIEEPILPPLAVALFLLAAFKQEFRSTGVFLGCLVTAYFMCVVMWWMPYFLNENRLTHIGRYAAFGSSPGEMLGNVLRRPYLPLLVLADPPLKLLHLGQVFLSLGFLPLLAGRWLLLVLVPILMMVLSSSQHQYTFSDHYAAALIPFLFCAGIHGAARIVCAPSRLLAVGFFAVLAFNLHGCPDYVAPWSRPWVAEVHATLSEIPSTASVCATDNVVPHVAARERVSMFGKQGRLLLDLRGYDYVILEGETEPHHGIYPFNSADYALSVGDVRRNPEYRLVSERGTVLLFQRK